MHLASYNNHLDLLRELLERFNCEPDKRDNKVFGNLEVWSYTHARSKQKSTGQALVQQLFSFVQLKWTPLYAAAQAGHIKIVQYLITERGCDFTVVTMVS